MGYYGRYISEEEKKMVDAYLNGEHLDELKKAASLGHPMAGYLMAINPPRIDGVVVSSEEHAEKCSEDECEHFEFDFSPAQEKFLDYVEGRAYYLDPERLQKIFKLETDFDFQPRLHWTQFWLQHSDSDARYFLGIDCKAGGFLSHSLKKRVTSYEAGEALLNLIRQGWLELSAYYSDIYDFLLLYAEMMRDIGCANADISDAVSRLQQVGIFPNLRRIENAELQLLAALGVGPAAHELGRRGEPLAIPRLNRRGRRDWIWGVRELVSVPPVQEALEQFQESSSNLEKWVIATTHRDAKAPGDSTFASPKPIFPDVEMPSYEDALEFIAKR